MNAEKLQELGGELGVTRKERRALRRMSLGERIGRVFDDLAASLLVLLSGILGLTTGLVVIALQPSYPSSETYVPPGGEYGPVAFFAGSAGITGFIGACYVEVKGGKEKGNKLFKVLVVTVLSVLAFTIGYGIYPVTSNWGMAFMYGVYSRDKGVAQ